MRFHPRKFILTTCLALSIFYLLFNYGFDYTPSQIQNPDKLEVQHYLFGHNGVRLNKIVSDQNTTTTSASVVVENKQIAEELPKQQEQVVQNTEVRRVVCFDSGGFGSVNKGILSCGNNIEVEVTDSNTNNVNFSFYHMGLSHEQPHPNQYRMVFTMESEPHSHGGDSWDSADFRMWYNLDLSYPEPATYFDVRTHLIDLLAPPKIEFEQKTNEAPIAWIVSNCNAFNGRQVYLGKLMELIKIDSYGGCLRNKHTHTGDRMRGNIELFSKYKFVIAIENSNCQDYVTEKLVHAIGSGSIPIVAGKDDRPNYLKFLPKNSFINIYDYKSQVDLARHLNEIASNKTLYESYMPFRRHEHTLDYLKTLTLQQLIDLSKKIIDPNEVFFKELVAKEKSENKLCKIARVLLNTPKDQLKAEIEKRKIKRPSTDQACLKNGNLAELLTDTPDAFAQYKKLNEAIKA